MLFCGEWKVECYCMESGKQNAILWRVESRMLFYGEWKVKCCFMESGKWNAFYGEWKVECYFMENASYYMSPE